jgi:TorA maturation chaperone TorD
MHIGKVLFIGEGRQRKSPPVISVYSTITAMRYF